MAKIEEVKEIFDRWRSQKPGRRSVPIAMRQMVVDLIGEYTLTRICRDLNLTMSNVKKWKVRLAEDRAFLASGVGGTEMVVPAAIETKVAISESPKPLTHGVSFLELGNIVGSSQQTTVEWRRANGESMRLVGAMSAKQVEILVQRFLSNQR